VSRPRPPERDAIVDRFQSLKAFAFDAYGTLFRRAVGDLAL
jgi:hypothetical protein